MIRPGNKILQFACSSSGKQRVGESGQCAAISPSRTHGVQVANGAAESSPNLADSLWASSHFNFHHKRPNGTFVNGPEAMDSVARGVILTVLLATLVGLGFWLCWGFSQAENAIIHRLGK